MLRSPWRPLLHDGGSPCLLVHDAAAEKKAIRKVEKKDKEAQKKAGKAEQNIIKEALKKRREKVD